jgi:hypothetical protein
MNKPIYLTFPIILLKDGLRDIKKCISNVMDYCLYDEIIRQKIAYSYNPINDALNKLSIKFVNVNDSIEIGQMIFDSIDLKAPKTSINLEMMFDFYKNKKSEFEIVCFLAFSALKSIIQKQKFKKITNEYLLSRMSGNSKSNEEINTLLERYACRYQLNKIKDELQLNWGLKYYAVKTRGFYVSFTVDIETLALIAERKNKKYKLKRIKERTKEASIKAKERIISESFQANN